MLFAQHLVSFVTFALLPLVQGYVPTTPSPNAPTGSNVSPVTLIVRRAPSDTFTTADVVRVQAGVTTAHPFSVSIIPYFEMDCVLNHI